MARKQKLPLVAICGRPNVGKSTLFNRLTGKQRAIVHAEEGITRDRTYGRGSWQDREFRLVDTGGIVENPIDPVLRKIQDQVRAALDEAHVIVFVLDGQQEITRLDEELRDELFRYGKPVIVAVNKLDNERLMLNVADFFALGLGDPIPVSSGHGIGVDDLLDAIVERLPEGPIQEEEDEEDDASDKATRVAVVGKPNVGKSSFVNALLNAERTIVHAEPGTTRDAIDIEFRWEDREYLLIDTAGLRRPRGIKQQVEKFSVSRSLRAVRRADVCLMMMDARDGITDQDKRILDYVVEQGRAIVLVWTKWDLIEDKEARLKSLNDEIDLKAPFLKYCPSITISNETRQRLLKTLDLVDEVAREVHRVITTPELNRFMVELGENVVPAMRRGRRARVFYATQAGTRPTRFILFVNSPDLFHFSYLRHIENKLRERFGFSGVPLKLELRKKRKED